MLRVAQHQHLILWSGRALVFTCGSAEEERIVTIDREGSVAREFNQGHGVQVGCTPREGRAQQQEGSNFERKRSERRRLER